MNFEKVRAAVARQWADDVLPSLSGLIEIPAVSPAYDRLWSEHGQLRAAADHMRDWALRIGLPGLRADVVEADGRSPLLVIEIPPSGGDGTTLIYGHLDKQPPLGDWSDGLGPWQPVIRGDRLYGRGAVDDGYSGYAALAAVSALRAAGGSHGRVVVLLETAEESGSPDLPAYLDDLADSLADVSLVVGLDSGIADTDRLWLTTSLRGALVATVTVTVADAAVHSGIAGGILPEPFRVLRQLLDRIEDSATGAFVLPELNAPIPPERRTEAATLAALHPQVAARFPLRSRAADDSDTELILNNTWRPTMTVIGLTGLPPTEGASVLQHGSVAVRLALRLPPTVRSADAADAVTRALTTSVPYDAIVEVTDLMLIDGWNAPSMAPWLESALATIGDEVFGRPPAGIGLGGGIPFIELLGRRYPDAQFVVTGAASTESNMHAPDESLNLPYAQRLTEAIAALLNANATR
ncbi:M20/M25/M40 family metallo-hydrolase [Asanoa hainanensis]|uniref:M20/M25/M40 family metallo-hydrolase n=1 Tax=Asanoa hainanensis TaxID=560556 RepID=UPI001C531FFE|nr:M20/M25/M40 family metallo-hydrolase [Asanoa hainanensis]